MALAMYPYGDSTHNYFGRHHRGEAPLQQRSDTPSSESSGLRNQFRRRRTNFESFLKNREIPSSTYASLQRKTEKLSRALSAFSSTHSRRGNAKTESSAHNNQFTYVTAHIGFPVRNNNNSSAYSNHAWENLHTTRSPPQTKPRHLEIVIPKWAYPDLSYISTSRSNCSPSLTSLSRDSTLREQSNLVKSQEILNSSPRSSLDSSKTFSFKTSFTSDNQKIARRYSPSMPDRQASPLKGNAASSDNSFSVTSPDIGSSAAQLSHGSAANLQSGMAAGSAPSLSSLVGAVHQTTGKAPPALVGASTTISGDKLYVFGGRRLSKRRTHLTQDMYELDLIQRHWTKLNTTGMIPAPRYFHSLCALGGTKLICYGGMAPSTQPTENANDPNQRPDGQQAEPGIIVMSDVHIYDILLKSWIAIPASNAPPGRYAHCATILPSYGVFTSRTAPLSSIKHGPSSSAPVTVDGKGGAEMVIVGGQDGASRYIEQISVFNLRSLRWTATKVLGKSCGAYRSVVAPLIGIRPTQLGVLPPGKFDALEVTSDENESSESGYPTLIYSNYNFLDVKLEMQIRLPDGTLTEKKMSGDHSPPGLRFPSGDIIDNHFLVSGTFLTSSKQEYALWALNLRSLTWSRIDAGPGVLTTGSWNRGLLWRRRNTFVILGDRRRKLADDYNHRRLNFANMCTVELEAFGLYDNPVRGGPWAGVNAASTMNSNPQSTASIGDFSHSAAAQSLGRTAAELKEGTDMDILAMGGERVAVNSHLIARRWGPYFNHLLEHSTGPVENGDTASTLRLEPGRHVSRMSSVTITPNSRTSFGSSTLQNSDPSRKSSIPSTLSNGDVPAPPTNRSRLLYLPHTYFTIKALVYYLYTSCLPPPGTSLCTPQILCSLLQIARPYRIDGLLEATVKRLHQVLDGRNTAAIFNAAAMAAGGGDDVSFADDLPSSRPLANGPGSSTGGGAGLPHHRPAATQIPTIAQSPRSDIDDSEDEALSSASASTTSLSLSQASEDESGKKKDEQEIWTGDLSAVIGLQKRGLRGLMEGRRIREQVVADGGGGGGGDGTQAQGQGAPPASTAAAGQQPATKQQGPAQNGSGVGLGIAP